MDDLTKEVIFIDRDGISVVEIRLFTLASFSSFPKSMNRFVN